MSSIGFLIKRAISTSVPKQGKRNFRKFSLGNNRGTKIFKQQQQENPDPDIPIFKYGVRDPGYYEGTKLVVIPEKIPELIVPDLTGFNLKPYVSYRTPDVTQSEFTSQDLFNVIYAAKIAKDYEAGKLNEDGSPKEPSPEEQLTPEDAKIKAQQTGTDIF